ncbi:MAG: hypothetical protein ACQGVC_24510 [Myxococcota bacterium]
MATNKLVREVRRLTRRPRGRLPAPRPPLTLGRDPVELHTLVCARDVPMSLWSIESFVAFSGLRPRVVVHGDGTLTDEHRELYGRYFEGIRVLDEPEHDARIDAALAPWPASRRARRTPGFYCARKLWDPLFVARSPTLLLLDSDVLFFRRPDRLLAYLASGQPCFSSDYEDAYAESRPSLERFAGHRVRSCVNSGVLHVPVEGYRRRLDRVERYFERVAARSGPVDPNRDEQTTHALLMSDLGAARLPPSYRIIGPVDAGTTSYHFVGEGKGRKAFWDVGVARLERALRVPAARARRAPRPAPPAPGA